MVLGVFLEYNFSPFKSKNRKRILWKAYTEIEFQAILSSITLQLTESLSIAMTFWEHSVAGMWWTTKGGWVVTEITQNELENTGTILILHLIKIYRDLNENMLWSFTPLHSSSTSRNVKDFVDHVTSVAWLFLGYQAILSIITLQISESLYFHDILVPIHHKDCYEIENTPFHISKTNPN